MSTYISTKKKRGKKEAHGVQLIIVPPVDAVGNGLGPDM